MSKPLPVTVLSGFLGAGKTTILKSVLNNSQGLKVAVIVNDMAEVNIDASLVQNGASAVIQSEEQLVEMSNGCICCTLRDDLLQSLSDLARKNKFDYILIEGSGISEPLPVAQTFSFEDKKGTNLQKLVTLDTLVTVVDPMSLLAQLKSDKSLKALKMAATKEDRRTLSELMTEQIEFANIIIVTKTDLATKDQVSQIEAILARMNPHAKIVKAQKGEIGPSVIMGTKLFDMEKSQSSSAWQDELTKVHIPETIEFGISSFTFKARRPFDPVRFADFLKKLPKNLVRAKGWFWMAGDDNFAWYFSRTGSENSVGQAAPWYATIEKKLWAKSQIAHIEALFEGPSGDRRQELVFIGLDLNVASLNADLEKCLLREGVTISKKNPFLKFV